MINKETLLDFDDLIIEPNQITNIKSRKTINTKYENGKYPLMTAPMDTVIDNNNESIFDRNDIIPVLPRNLKTNNSNTFISYSLESFVNEFLQQTKLIIEPINVLIDIANGHMLELYNVVNKTKQIYGDKIILMIGNIANPQTYDYYKSSGVDYIRLGVGNGNACLTTFQTGIGYPMASLIDECNKIKNNINPYPKIVADGGFKKYADIIKALGLGADYVMLGSIFNQALESASVVTKSDGEKINQYSALAKKMFEVDVPLFKSFRGMSTKEVQKKWDKKEITTSEGIVKQQLVKYTLSGWLENFDSYLRSAMSYTNHQNIKDFIGGVDFNKISEKSYERFNK